MGSIAYQNKDIASKVTAEALIGKSLAPFGLPDLKVMDILPTNLPAIESNELRLDNLFLLEDDSLGILDYESVFTKENFVKYINYVARILKRYANEKDLDQLRKIRILVIYTADVEQAKETYDLGGIVLCIEAAYLIHQNTDEIYEKLNRKIHQKEDLSEEEMAQLMILPLTVKGNEEKQTYIEKTVKLAKKIEDREQCVRALAGILTFSDKVIDQTYAQIIKEELCMTKVGQLIFDDGVEQGIERGIEILIRTCKDFHMSRKDVLDKIKKESSLSDEKITEYLDKYW